MNIYNQYIITGLIMILLDAIFLYNIKDFANKQILSIQGSSITMKFSSVILCYVILTLGLNYFIINNNKSILDAFILGIVIYGVYETTNYALFDKWLQSFAVMDTIWGGVTFALTTKIFYYIREFL